MSLRARLVAATSLVALIALVIAGVATYNAFASSQLRQIDDSLQRAHEPVEQAVNANDPNLKQAIQLAAPGSFVAVQDTDGDTVVTVPAREPGHPELMADLGDFDDVTWPANRQPGDHDIAVYRTVTAASGGTELRVRVSRLSDGSILIVGQSLQDAIESRHRLIVIELIVAAAALLIAGAVGWILVRIGLRPLRRVEQTALLIADAGDLDHEVPGEGRATEVGRLASALNTMLGRIRGAFEERDANEAALRSSEERMRRFVADVSHELRTPLAAVKAYTELFDRGLRNHPDDLERALRGIDIEAARMQELVEELLLLARLDEGRPLSRAKVDLNEVVVEAITAARAVSPDRPISLKVSDVVTIAGDASRLRQVIDNLLANVRTHTPPGTTTKIELRTEGPRVVMTISDNGPGMTAEQAGRVFERFYRADPSRSRTSGGAGLGMAIVHGLVTAHEGTIRLDTSPGNGLRVIISLPIIQPVNDEPASSPPAAATPMPVSAVLADAMEVS